MTATKKMIKQYGAWMQVYQAWLYRYAETGAAK